MNRFFTNDGKHAKKFEICLYMTVGALREVGKILRFLLFHLFTLEILQYFRGGLD